MNCMRANSAEVRSGMNRGVEAIQDEFRAFRALMHSEEPGEGPEGPRPWWASPEMAEEAHECMEYCVHARAGSSDKRFVNSSFARDCDENGVRADRVTASGLGMQLVDFCALPEVRTAKLEAAHVVSLRLYAQAAFNVINGPLREPWGRRAHPFPVTTSFLSEAITKLRAVDASKPEAHTIIDLWRGLTDVSVSREFMEKGGTELAPLSSTSKFNVAMQYSEGAASLLFKLRTSSFMSRGASIAFLSAFPSEDETVFPPLTYLKPTGKCEEVVVVEIGTSRVFTIVEVEPHFGSV